MSDIIKVQHSLARKAQSDANHQFDHLYRIICNKEWINEALEIVLQNQGAKTAGIDGVTYTPEIERLFKSRLSK